jgi:hypothetical protein
LIAINIELAFILFLCARIVFDSLNVRIIDLLFFFLLFRIFSNFSFISNFRFDDLYLRLLAFDEFDSDEISFAEKVLEEMSL